MSNVESLITEHIDTWTSAVKTKSTVGRGKSKKRELYGIKKLREMVLELAIRGLLVQQRKDEDNASDLIVEILNEKDRLTKEEGLKTKASEKISDDDKYVKTPESWEYIRLGNLAKFIDYRGKTPKKTDSGVRLITAKNVRFGYINLTPEEYISEEEYGAWMTRGFPEMGDLLFTPEAPLGNVAVIDLNEKFALAQRAICFQLHIKGISEFLKYIIMSPSFQEQLILNATGMTATGIKASKLKEIPIPLPSLEEQNRIVSKINELMALCDQLEQQTDANIDAHEVLVSTLLKSLTDAAENSENDTERFQQAWERVAENFDLLFTTEGSVDQLKQTILQLAVMGKLVPQDPNDEPASVLLKKVAIEKEQLIKEKKIKKQKPLLAITDDDVPFKLPRGWKWSRFFEANTVRSDLVAALDFPNEQQVAPDTIEKNTGRLIAHRTVVEAGAKGPNNRFNQGQLLYSKIRPSLNKVVIAPYDGLCSADMYPIDSYIDTSFVLYAMLSEVFLVQVRSAENRVKMPKLNLDSLGKFLFPIPPLAEQQRIAARISELFSLCEALKEKIKHAQLTQIDIAASMTKKAIM